MTQPDLQSAQRKLFSNPVIVLVGGAGIFFTSQVLGGLLAQIVLPYVHSSNYQLVIYITCNFVALASILYAFFSKTHFGYHTIGWIKVSLNRLAIVVPTFIIYFVVSAMLTLVTVRLFPAFRANQTQDIGFNDLKHPLELVLSFLTLSVLTPILEETIFRGIIFKGLRRTLPFWISAIVTSLLFAIAHLQWNVALDTFALSLALCFLVEKTTSIIPGILLHAMKNTLAFLLLFIIR